MTADVEFCQVVTMYQERDLADALAELLVARRLAASVHVEGPVTARFWWDGGVQTVEEWRVTCKTTMDRYDEIEALINDKEHHLYDLPEVLAIPVLSGSDRYLAWIAAETRTAGTPYGESDSAGA
ncbi:divalent cation tolerance protein [Promicromonospora sp. AC04]|uniref:divalent-cation tolerance protein CutA n=1 Tax=Promicromonospora sp. AC04 TaxID=2135723 RepID=UPI000D3CBAAE|nr:divalent-cation tolerance protein CutA [Promicromonospora sp. AC04]PUB20836.1 divalent cation tolerance protein [Promicromonospora sp. AC04]